jgi:TetR/AcrR family transcriptional regulator, transcriptional repressor for nem operon
MARPREYDSDAVVSAAKDVFWERGYEATGLDLLEAATHLSRSSMYLAFESKRGLFEAALTDYVSTFVEPVLLGPVEEGSTAADAAEFFVKLAALLRGDLGSRGCLMVNSIGELAGRDAGVARRGAEMYERHVSAFAGVLGGGEEGAAVAGQRARILAVSAMGVWITSRVDPEAAAEACDVIVEQIRLWAASRS